MFLSLHCWYYPTQLTVKYVHCLFRFIVNSWTRIKWLELNENFIFPSGNCSTRIQTVPILDESFCRWKQWAVEGTVYCVFANSGFDFIELLFMSFGSIESVSVFAYIAERLAIDVKNLDVTAIRSQGIRSLSLSVFLAREFSNSVGLVFVLQLADLLFRRKW